MPIDRRCDQLAFTGVQPRLELLLPRRAGRMRPRDADDRSPRCGRRLSRKSEAGRGVAAVRSRAGRDHRARRSGTISRSARFTTGLVCLSTAGGLVFAGEHKGQVSALDARTGKSLWHFNTGDLITSSPISYAIDGQQYIAISSGAQHLRVRAAVGRAPMKRVPSPPGRSSLFGASLSLTAQGGGRPRRQR